MADKSISELPVSPGMTDDALLVVYQNGETESIEGRLIKGYAREAVKDFVDGAEKSAKDAAGSATEAKKSETLSKENADKTAADVLVVKATADSAKKSEDSANDAAEDAAKCAATLKVTVVQASISAVWVGESAPYRQTILVPEVVPSSVVDIKPTAAATTEQRWAFYALCATDGGQSEGNFTIEALGALNAAPIPIDVIVRSGESCP